MQVGSATSKGNPQDIPRSEIPPIIEKIAKYGFWIGAGLCFGFWIHSAFVYAGAAFFLASFVCSQIVRAEKPPKNSPVTDPAARAAAAASTSCIGREPQPRLALSADTFNPGADPASASASSARPRVVDEVFSDEDDQAGAEAAVQMVPGDLTQEDMDELDEQEAAAVTHGDAETPKSDFE